MASPPRTPLPGVEACGHIPASSSHHPETKCSLQQFVSIALKFNFSTDPSRQTTCTGDSTASSFSFSPNRGSESITLDFTCLSPPAHEQRSPEPSGPTSRESALSLPQESRHEVPGPLVPWLMLIFLLAFGKARHTPFPFANEGKRFVFCESKTLLLAAHPNLLTLKLLALKCQRQMRLCKMGHFLQVESSLMELSLLLKISFYGFLWSAFWAQ